MPFTAGSAHAHAWTGSCSLAVTCGFRERTCSSAPFRARLSTATLSRAEELPGARSPSDPTATPHAANVERRQRHLWTRHRPTTSATCYQTYGHALEHPALRTSWRLGRSLRPRREACSRSRVLAGTRTSPVEEVPRELRSRDQPYRSRTRDAGKNAARRSPGSCPQSTRRLRATPRPGHRLRRWPLENSAGLHGPREAERGTGRSAACWPHGGRTPAFPSSGPTSGTPVRHRLFEPRAGCPEALTSRSRPSFLRRPAKDDAFPKTGVPFTPGNHARQRGSLPDRPDEYHP